MLIGEIYSTIIYCFATFGLFSNLFLIWLILRYTMKEMQVYSKILLQTCFVDIVGICMFVVSQPVNKYLEYRRCKKNSRQNTSGPVLLKEQVT
ncbi:unnamed protein product [Meloidogyne enterolobii]|uniref:Uncharacterized protein n=1 Tax=Meloidogyne enterolobii TaxID=390850 RepID=A0ACB0YU09_MELEN